MLTHPFPSLEIRSDSAISHVTRVFLFLITEVFTRSGEQSLKVRQWLARKPSKSVPSHAFFTLFACSFNLSLTHLPVWPTYTFRQEYNVQRTLFLKEFDKLHLLRIQQKATCALCRSHVAGLPPSRWICKALTACGGSRTRLSHCTFGPPFSDCVMTFERKVSQLPSAYAVHRLHTFFSFVHIFLGRPSATEMLRLSGTQHSFSLMVERIWDTVRARFAESVL